MNNTYKKVIVYIAVYIMIFSSFVVLAHGTATSITIYGTNQSNAQTNVTCYGCNQTISVQAWNTSYVKNISVHSRNGSGGDAVSFNISNVTAYQVQELKVNGTSINAYQAGANGMLNFTYTVVGNRTLVLSPAMNANGYNFTWGWFWNMPNTRIKVGSFTRDMSLASGTQAITGLGFKPQGISFSSSNSTTNAGSFGGYDDGTTAVTTYIQSDGTILSTTVSIVPTYTTGGSAYYLGNIQSMDSDGFTINWVKGGTTTGTGTMNYMAFK